MKLRMKTNSNKDALEKTLCIWDHIVLNGGNQFNAMKELNYKTQKFNYKSNEKFICHLHNTSNNKLSSLSCSCLITWPHPPVLIILRLLPCTTSFYGDWYKAYSNHQVSLAKIYARAIRDLILKTLNDNYK